MPDRPPCGVLIRVWPGHEFPAPHRQRQNGHPEAEKPESRECREPRRIRTGVVQRDAPLEDRINRNGTAAPSSAIVSVTRVASARAPASFTPRGPPRSSTNIDSRTPRPPGANATSKPIRYDVVKTLVARVHGRDASGNTPRVSATNANPYAHHATAFTPKAASMTPGAIGSRRGMDAGSRR